MQIAVLVVAHLGDPAVAAHRRRLVRWLPVAEPLLACLGVFTAMLILETPHLEALIGLLHRIVDGS